MAGWKILYGHHCHKQQVPYDHAIFRQEVEHTSGHVMEMMELIPITRAHALEEEEIQKMTGYLEHVAENGYRLDVVQNLFGATGWVIFQVSQLVCLGFTSYLESREK